MITDTEAARHVAELEEPIGPVCSRCGHRQSDHDTPGMECIALLSRDGEEPRYCSCASFRGFAPEGA